MDARLGLAHPQVMLALLLLLLLVGLLLNVSACDSACPGAVMASGALAAVSAGAASACGGCSGGVHSVGVGPEDNAVESHVEGDEDHHVEGAEAQVEGEEDHVVESHAAPEEADIHVVELQAGARSWRSVPPRVPRVRFARGGCCETGPSTQAFLFIASAATQRASIRQHTGADTMMLDAWCYDGSNE